MTRIDKIFRVRPGNKLDFGKMTIQSDGIAFVSRTSQNNGVVGFVEEINGTKPFPAGLITVSLGGTYVLSSFVQPQKFYTAQNVAVLEPLFEMSLQQKIYLCQCLSLNRYRYSAFGREANRTLKGILVPDISEIPKWVSSAIVPSFEGINAAVGNSNVPLDVSEWRSFKYSQLFEVKKGKRVTKPDMIPGSTPFLGAIDKNNGIREYAGLVALHTGNTISVNYNGSVGEAFYQEHPYWASDDINVLYPKFTLNKYIAMFLIALIRQDKYRFNYGRKWHKERMEDSIIKLPTQADGKPDWDYIEQYIKSLSYSASI